MKKIAAGLALALAASAFAVHPQTINKHGMVGVNETQSAQALGHSKLVFSALADLGIGGYDDVAIYRGAKPEVGFAVGLGDYFDIGLTLPITYDYTKVTTESESQSNYNYWTPRGNVKFRLPLPDDQPADLALYGSATGSSFDALVIDGGAALTLDFDKSHDVPFLIHVNGGLNYALSANTMSYYGSGALEMYFFDFMSVFAEYRMDIQTVKTPNADTGEEEKSFAYGNKVHGALVFHLPVGLDIHMGASYGWANSAFPKIFKSKDLPIYGGITWSGFLLPQDRDGDGVKDNEDDCPDDYGHRLNRGCPLGNPDSDEDGVCDAWVYEKGFEDEYAEICEGVDKCPNEPGEGDDGCELADPDPDKDGVCDPWVAQKKMLKKFKKICKGIDECPAQAGDPKFNGCPGKLPDPDNDGMCSPWVTDEGVMDQYSDQCQGYDMCPGEAGTKANKGCPWDDPDVDGDGLCDPWVAEKKMGYYFEKAAEDETIANEWFIDKSCKAIDKCPTEHGPASNEGCPLGMPDTDGDGVCDAWVTEKGMQEQYDDICTGIDKCPTEAGEQFANGCPMDNPDIDGDSLCAPWVTEKKMQKQFAEICKGIDKCETEAGPAWNKGCPVDDPDPDKDGLCSQWVTKQNLLSKFADVCKGKDMCEDEAGPDWNKGCPSDDQPDPDGDGLCSPWVSKKGLSAKFKDVCKGTDKCEDEAGPDWNKGCPAQSPDPDEDGLCSPWVTKQKLLDKFADECSGYDRCEDEPGPDWNNGCPSDDEPDADHDGVCSEWVTTKKLTKQFADQCSGIDRCPDVAGDDGHGCPKKGIEKLDGVTFKSGKATLESNAKLILKNVAKKLNTDEYKELQIVIQGHTDNVGKEASNQKLSENRAKEVMKALTKAGVNKKRIKAIGLGSSCPVDDNSTEDGREMNRRIEMHFASADNDGTKCESNFVGE
ncbi:MAG: OmpA family protein [Fibrobacter sp.]|nr:OmpA family protein [Fibrobacter sp.]